MAHRRTEIRNLTVERLRAALTVAGDQVYPGRFQSAHEEELYNGGVIFVYTLEETILRKMREDDDGYPASNWGSVLYRDLDLEIHGVVPAFYDQTPETADFERDALLKVDELSGQIETALEGWDPPGFETASLRLRKSKSDIDTEAGGMPVARCELTYWMRYRTAYRAGSDPLVDNEHPDLERRGLYPGGQVIEGIPGGNDGEPRPNEGDVRPAPEPHGFKAPGILFK